MTLIDVVMTTRDGGAHLAAQLDSILAQSHQDWRLIVRDDGSSDDSVEILEQYRRRHPDRITTLSDADGTLGWVQNFARVLEHSSARYTALCDQDDVWLPDKLATSLQALCDLERGVEIATPSLVFTDLKVVDAHLSVLADSFWEHAHIDPERANDLGTLISRNVVTGNTMMFNATLRKLALPIPTCVDFHDAWIAAVACAAGATTYVREPTVLYRQHPANASGVKRRTRPSPARIIGIARDRRVRQERRRRHRASVSELCQRTAALISPQRKAILEAYLELQGLGAVRRVLTARRHGLLPHGWLRSAAFIAESGVKAK